MPDSDTVTVTAGKTVDIHTTCELREEIRAALRGRPAALVVDFTATEHMDAAGPAVVVGARRRAAAHGGRVIVVCNDENVLRPFNASGLTRIIDIRPAPPGPPATAGE